MFLFPHHLELEFLDFGLEFEILCKKTILGTTPHAWKLEMLNQT